MEGLKKVDKKFNKLSNRTFVLKMMTFRKRPSLEFRIAKLYLLVVADVRAEASGDLADEPVGGDGAPA